MISTYDNVLIYIRHTMYIISNKIYESILDFTNIYTNFSLIFFFTITKCVFIKLLLLNIITD